MKSVERRRFPRVRDYHSIAYTHYDDRGDIDDQGMARTLDVSRRGVLLETVTPMSPGTRLTLEMQVGEEILSLQGQVVHSGELPNGHFRVGLDLFAVPEALLVQIEQQLRLQDILIQAVARLKAKGGGILLYRPASDDLEIALSYNLEVDSAVFQECEELAEKVLKGSRPMAVTSYSRQEAHAEVGPSACVAMPIPRDGRPWGILIVVDDAPRTFSPDDIALLERFALLVAALENTRPYR